MPASWTFGQYWPDHANPALDRCVVLLGLQADTYGVN